ncbi:DUF6289 family protein [Dyella nitratireducens]|uniref:Uncharacterized protein n=1 Tax=Dyella nitratireducens TaxID=1849580 RepID=A0ABQ1FUM2_9GAMM|nr:hypothetical protein GCM10010981_18260 [Dyella nitratireducens]GLQ43110.1 hypothetical protein GCM10007902_29600 [Dyella nitratireducens]
MKLSYALIAGLVGIATLSASAIALAAPADQTTITYYSTAAKTTAVGSYTRYCNNTVSQSGTQTTYFTETSIPCAGGGGGGGGGGSGGGGGGGSCIYNPYPVCS